MYEAYYGLSSKPFQLNPDPNFYFGSKPHRRARAYLEYGVMRAEGFIVITGEVGAGKTTIVRGLLDSIDPHTMVAAQLVSTQLGAEDTLRLVGAAFGVQVRDASKAELLMALEAFFITQLTQGKRCLLIVDEAQNLRPQAVEELRMLSNFQHGKQALLQTFLIGQPEFRNILQSPDMLQLRQRVTASCHLGPMNAEETQGYIEHRLRCAGAIDKPTFDAEVFAVIFEQTGGIPRRINALCDRLMLHGFLSEVTHFTVPVLNEVLGEIREELTAPPLEQVSGAAVLQAAPGALRGSEGTHAELDIELDTSQLRDLEEQLSRLTAGQLSAHLLRIERSVLRQERLSIEILSALQKLAAGRGHA
ncbi:MAG: XrtA-associated ATPase [Aquabacterium sp.]|jgi:putative secretion ATPase (PEP-CTERM system associated)|uniref:XrtA/PEP-CTERM system-associated ATPase n=1 Tax=Aquabacterium sp. TaxID=1872578 RepID=UPI001B6AEFB5|nr:XrtA/PEP-CTERM system-associated ATPase [Aquabacterium sp.]MBP7131715.1 XrtA-associated ATPase [Aquabacterium sp.]MDQ5926430.1 ral secretion pathway protein [Pseudomonadota bacterium]